jgi:hypothetical protein
MIKKITRLAVMGAFFGMIGSDGQANAKMQDKISPPTKAYLTCTHQLSSVLLFKRSGWLGGDNVSDGFFDLSITDLSGKLIVADGGGIEEYHVVTGSAGTVLENDYLEDFDPGFNIRLNVLENQSGSANYTGTLVKSDGSNLATTYDCHY